jgi:hypothetical protein
VSEASVTSLESDWERSGSLGNMPGVSGVAEVAEGRWWLECGPGRAGVARDESWESLGVSPESRQELLGVGS